MQIKFQDYVIYEHYRQNNRECRPNEESHGTWSAYLFSFSMKSDPCKIVQVVYTYEMPQIYKNSKLIFDIQHVCAGRQRVADEPLCLGATSCTKQSPLT
jgi:hypothetical protein